MVHKTVLVYPEWATLLPTRSQDFKSFVEIIVSAKTNANIFMIIQGQYFSELIILSLHYMVAALQC